MWRIRTPIICSAIVACLLLLGSVTVVARQEAIPSSSATPSTDLDSEAPLPSFEIFPKDSGPGTFFDVTQEAGTDERYTVVLANSGDEESGDFEGRAFAVDVRVALNGGLETGGPTDEKTGPTSWLEFPNDIVTLKAGTGIERTFTVSVPEGTPPGEYVTALCFETAEPLEIPGVPNLKQNLRKTIAFYITVPGDERPEFSIENIRMVIGETWSGLEAEIVNSGNVRVRPEGRVTISSTDGEPLITSELAYGAFFAGMTGRVQFGFGDLLPPGDYLVTLELRDPETGATAIVENHPISTSAESALAEESAPPVSFLGATGELKPSGEEPQFLQIEATLENTAGEQIDGAELSLKVTRDGELVENYVVVSPLALPAGETQISNRYIPLDGWEPGTWSFTLSVQVHDRETGVSTIVSSIQLGEPIDIE